MRSPVVASVLAMLAVPPTAIAAEPPPAPPPAVDPGPSTQPSPATTPAGRSQPPADEPPQAPAPRPAASRQDEAERKKLEEEIAKQLGARPSAAAPATAPAQSAGPAPAAGGVGGSAIARVLLLPDISVIGDFALAFDSYDVPTASPRLELFGPTDKPTPLFKELELGFQSVVDPYVRADVFASVSPDGADVEEAYLTTLTLPAGLQARLGKLFSPFGRLNQQHPHVHDFVDVPLAQQRVLADDVLSGPGVDLAWLAPLPWFAELHLAGQGTAPFRGDRERLTGLARLLQYFPLGDATTLGVGVTAGVRDEGRGAFRDVGGADLYVRIRPVALRSWFVIQGELYGARFRGVPGTTRGGGYGQVFWRDGPFSGYGVRYDDAPSAGDAGPGRERRTSAVATWFPSEFQRYSVQLSWDRRPGGADGAEGLLLAEFVMGAHGAHPF